MRDKRIKFTAQRALRGHQLLGYVTSVHSKMSSRDIVITSIGYDETGRRYVRHQYKTRFHLFSLVTDTHMASRRSIWQTASACVTSSREPADKLRVCVFQNKCRLCSSVFAVYQCIYCVSDPAVSIYHSSCQVVKIEIQNAQQTQQGVSALRIALFFETSCQTPVGYFVYYYVHSHDLTWKK